ncbi:MAG TPA: DUF4037 domain-containing protein, partial [Dehalococcoidia bacterium]|nr:DUF4037 domain-containing protein [Dehalococcoidia bacterium]
ICRPLHDPSGGLATLKERLVPYPPPLKRAIVNRFLWAAEFDLAQAVKVAAQGDVYSAAGCFTRVASHLVQILYALNERYFVSDKGALDEMRGLGLCPPALAETLVEVLSRPGHTPSELSESASRLSAALRDLVALAGNLYERPSFRA